MKTSSIRWAIVSALTALAAAGLAAGCDGVGSRTPATLEQGLVPPPPAPSDLVVVAVNAGQANLTWADNSADETEFRVQRADDEDFTVGVVEQVLPANATQATDFTLRGLTTYFFRVLAVNADGASTTPPVRVFTPVSKPTVAVASPPGAPALFQSGELNGVEALATGVGAGIASAEYQLLFQDAPGTFIAQDLMAQPDDSPYVIPAPLDATPVADATPVPPLPPSAIVELQIYGRVAQAGDAGNGYEWRIGGTAAAPTYFVYESASTRFPRPRRPAVGDAVWITALRTQASGPLVATRITFRAPDPQPVAPATGKLAALYKGTIESFEAAFSVPGVSYGGQAALVHNAVDNLTIPFRFDFATVPAFEAFVDDGLLPGNAVEVRFFVAPPTQTRPTARQVFPQVSPLSQPPVNPNPTFVNDDPVPMGLPPGTFVQFMINGVVTAVNSDLKTWQIGDPADPTVVYGHAATLPISDLFRAAPAVGDFVIVTARRTLEPGPLVADQILILFDGPAPSFAIRETSIQIVYLFNGLVTDVAPGLGGSRWTVSGRGGPQEFIMDDPWDPAVVDPGALPSLGLGSLVTVEFVPPTQTLPEAGWGPLALDSGSGLWRALAALPAVPEDRLGTLFVRTTDVAGQTSTVAIPARLLAGSPNTAPLAADDAYAASGTATLSVPAPGVLANDSDPDLGALTAELVAPPAGVSAFALEPDGSFSFTYGSNPPADTPVTFTYRVSDGIDVSEVATVTVTVAHANLPPVAAPDTYAVTGAAALSVPAPGVLGNDSDPEAGPLVAELVSPPEGASAFALEPDGSFSFTYGSNPAAATAVTFTYRVGDGSASSAPATVTVLVGHENQAPTATGDAFTVTGTAQLVVFSPGVLLNDTDPELGPLTAELVSPPSGADAFTFNPDGSFLFTYGSNPAAPTEVTFTYRAGDGAAFSEPATVTITVLHAGVSPVAVGDAYAATGTATLAVAAPGVLGNDSDPEGEPLTAVLVSPPAGASAFALEPDGSFTFAHGTNPPAATPVTFSYRASDGTDLSAVATVTIVVNHANEAPVATADAFTATGTEPLVVPAPGVLLNDTDAEPGPLTAQLVSPPAGASDFTLNPDGSFSFAYGSNPAAPTAVTFTYRASDGAAVSGTATVTVTVQPQALPGPAAPGGLAATLLSGPRVQLSATDNAADETGFVIERAVGSGAFAPLATTPASPGTGPASYVDASVSAGFTYRYRARAVSGLGESAWSNVATLAVPGSPPAPPLAPSGLTLAAAVLTSMADRVTATWADNSTDETGFTIQVSTSPTFASVTAFTLGADLTSYFRTGVPRGVTLYVRIRAYNAAGASLWSNVATLTTP